MNPLRDPALRRAILPFAIPWAVMLLLIGVELVLMLLHVGPAAPFIALVMVGIVAVGPMQLLKAPNAARIFALAGVFWLTFALFSLGTLDPLTRHDQPTHFISKP